MNEMPRAGDVLIRSSDGARFTIQEVVEAGGEEVYHLRPERGGDGVKITGASLVKEHDQTRAEYEPA